MVTDFWLSFMEEKQKVQVDPLTYQIFKKPPFLFFFQGSAKIYVQLELLNSYR